MGTAAAILICSLAASPCSQSRSADAFPPFAEPVNWSWGHDPVYRSAMQSAETLDAAGLEDAARNIACGFAPSRSPWMFKPVHINGRPTRLRRTTILRAVAPD